MTALVPALVGVAAALPAATLSKRAILTWVHRAPPYWLLFALGAVGTALPALAAPDWTVLIASILLTCILLSLAFIDRSVLRLPDALTLPLIGVGLVWGSWKGQGLVDHLLGAAIGYGLLWGIAVYYRRFRRREGLGLGDAKLLAAGGAWLGWQALPPLLVVATMTALIGVGVMAIRRGAVSATSKIAFGPYLALALWALWTYRAMQA